MLQLNKANLREVLTRSSYFSAKTFVVSDFVSETLLQMSRVPHAYGFAFSAVGSAPHLLEFEGVNGFDGLMHADGFDVLDAAVAMQKTVFELLERVWCFDVPKSKIVRATQAELGDRALDPEDLVLPSAFEYERLDGIFVEYSDQIELDWIPCHSLTSATPTATQLVPVVLAYQGYGHRHPTQRITPVLSTGLAAGTRYDDAILRAVCEVIERDAFMVRWLGTIAPRLITNVQSFFTDEISETVAMLEEDGFTVRFYDLTLDVPVPVILAAIQKDRQNEAPVTVLGLGCDPLAESALAKALQESLEMMPNQFDFQGGSDVQQKEAGSKRTPEEQRELARFLAGTKKTKLRPSKKGDYDRNRDMPAKLIAMLEDLAEAGFSAYYCDLTPTSKGRAEDFVLVRALMPHLQPMLYEQNCWRLKNKRLFKIIKDMVPGSAALSESDLNLQIHPFAADEVA